MHRCRWLRTATSGHVGAAWITSVSSRCTASRALLAWHVDNEPSWPGVQRLHEPEHLGPAHLTDDEAVGPEAQRGVEQPLECDRGDSVGRRRPGLQPHDVIGGRCQLGGVLEHDDPLARRVTIVSRLDSSDVLPDDVAPDTTTLQRRSTRSARTCATGWGRERVEGEGVVRKRRSDRQVPPSEIGGTTAHTRVPSASRASTIGVVRSSRRPSGARIRSITMARSARWDLAPPREVAMTFDPDVAIGVHEHLVDGRIAEQRVEGAEAVEPGDSRPDEALGVLAAGQGSEPANVGADGVLGVARLVLRGAAQRRDETVVEVAAGHHATRRGSLWMLRGSLPASRPRSAARAICGSYAIFATTGAFNDRAMSAADQVAAGLLDEHDPVRRLAERGRAGEGDVARTGDEQAACSGRSAIDRGIGWHETDRWRAEPDVGDELDVARRHPPAELGPARRRCGMHDAPRGTSRVVASSWIARSSTACGGASDSNQSLRPWPAGVGIPSA